MKPTYETLSAAIKARAWARERKKKTGRWPDVEVRVRWIVTMFRSNKIDVAYVNKSVEDQELLAEVEARNG